MQIVASFIRIFSRIAVQQFKLMALLACALMLSAAPARAQLTSVPTAGIELVKMEVLHNVPQGLSLAQVHSGQAGAFETANGLSVFHGQWYRAVWLRMHFQANPVAPQPLQNAVLGLPTPFLDTVRVYTPGNVPDAPWSVQIGGDFIVPSAWTIRGLYPKFNIAQPGQSAWQGGQQMVLYVQVDHLAPVTLKLEIAESSQLQDRELLSLMFYCLGFGAILLVVLITAVMAWLHRDGIYGWYSAYALCAGLSGAAHAGVAQHVLWPVSGYWPGTAVLSFLLLSCACAMKFSMALNSEHVARLKWRHTIHFLCAICVLIAFCFPVLTDYWREFFFATLGVIVITLGLSIVLMVIGARSGSKLALAWLIAFVPLFLTIALSLLEGIGLIQPNQWSYSLVIYAATLEVLTLGLALQWFARERHGQKSREKALAATDPLTGFATKDAFQSRLLRDWNRPDQQQDLAVAYIELITKPHSQQSSEQLLRRSVRVLRSATNAQDMVARLDGQLMAILMPHAQMGDDLSQRLSRIVALGLMPDRSDPHTSILQFRIAATTRRNFTRPLSELDAQLRELIALPTGWGSKPIRYIDQLSLKRNSRSPSMLPDLDDVWERAFNQEQKDTQAPIKP